MPCLQAKQKCIERSGFPFINPFLTNIFLLELLLVKENVYDL